MWDFSTDPEFQAKLDWMDTFVREEVEPLDHLTHQDEHTVYAPLSPELAKIVRPLQDKVRKQGLWACHLGPELGGQGQGAGILVAAVDNTLHTPRHGDGLPREPR